MKHSRKRGGGGGRFSGEEFSQGNFLEERLIFPGGIFPRGRILLGKKFPGGSFPGKSFPRGVVSSSFYRYCTIGRNAASTNIVLLLETVISCPYR